MKRIYIFCLAVIILLLSVQPAGATTEQRRVMLAVDSKLATVNGEVRFLKTPPFIAGGRTLVPLRFISTAFSSDIEWNQATKTAHIRLEGQHIKISPGMSYAKVNNYQVELEAPALIKEKTIFIPLRFVSDTMGAQIQWNGANRTINITMNLYKHDKAGFSFILPGSLTVYKEDECTASFSGPGDRALIVEKISGLDTGEAKKAAKSNFEKIKEEFPQAKILLESEYELWISKGNLTMLCKVVPRGENYFFIVYQLPADRFEQQGRYEYQLVVNTLKDLP